MKYVKMKKNKTNINIKNCKWYMNKKKEIITMKIN